MKSLFNKIFIFISALTFSMSVWGGNVTLKATAESSPSTQGYVYVAKSNSAPSSYSLTSDHADETKYSAYILFYGYTTVDYTFYLFASAKDGYGFTGWSKKASDTSGDTSNPKSVTVSGKESGTVTDGPYYAHFTPVTVNSVASNSNPTTKPLSITQPGAAGAKTATVVFNVSNADAVADFTVGLTGTGWEVTSSSYANNQITVNLKYSATATTTQGNHSGTVTLTSQATDGTSKSATVVANVDLTPTISANPTSKNFGEYTLAKDTKKSQAITLTFNANAVNFEKTADASIAPFSAVFSANHQTLTVYFEPTTIGNWSKDLVVTVKNSQSTQLSATCTIHLSGSAKRNNVTYTCNIADNYMVDATAINLASLWTSNNNEQAPAYDIVSFTPSGSNNTGATAPAIDKNNMLSLGQAGTVELKLTQAESVSYNAGETTKTITILKRANTIACDWDSWSTNMSTDDGTAVHFSSDNSEEGAPAITVTQTSGEANATYYPEQHAIYTSFNLGSATWTVAQAENYKYVGDTKTMTVNIITVAEGCNVYGPAYPDKEASLVGEINLPKAGAGNVLSFQMKKKGAGNQAKLTAFDANGNQLAVWYPEAASAFYYDNASTHAYTLPAGTKKINFQCPGSGIHALDDPYITSIRISRTEWITLQDVGGNTITSLEKMTNTIGGNSATATFYVDNSVCASEVRVASNNAHITVSPTSFTPTAERQMITVTYSSATPEDIDATITVYTASQNATLSVEAETEKQTPYLTWGSLYQAEPVSLPVTFSDNAAATASNDAVVTYSVRAGEESVISIGEGALSFTIVGEGTAHLTATSAESTMWKSISETKEIRTTNKKIQNIVWNQNFTRGLKFNDERALTAEVSIYDLAAKTEEVSAERTALIQYTCPAANGVIEKIDATHFRVIGYGETTITASVAGDEEYEAASSVTKIVNVREAQTGVCDPALMTEVTNEILFEAFSLGFPEVSHEVELDRSKGQPDKLSFYVRGVSYNLAIEYYEGGIDVYESTDGGAHWSGILSSVNPEKNTTAYSDQIQLSANATHLRFVRAQGGMGYHYVGGINVTTIPELRVADAELSLGNIGCGATYNGNIELSYFNVKGELSVAKANSTNGLSITETIDSECGTTRTINVPFSVFPTEEGAWSNTVTITDELQHMSVEVHMTATVTKASQSIVWDPALTVTGNNPPVLNATATSGLPVTYAITSGSNAAIINNEVVITGTGSFTIRVSQAGNVSYRSTSLDKTFTVNPITLILTAPTASDITTDQKLGDSELNGGSAEDSEHNAVDGTWAWYDDEETAYTAGNYTPQVVFSPAANSGWYENVVTTTALKVRNGQFIYTGTGEWETTGNWNLGTLPTSDDDVLVTGNLTIDQSVEVKSLTIEGEGAVTMVENGVLTINGDSKDEEMYGNLFVKNGGEVVVNGSLRVRDLTVEASIGTSNGTARSGQIDQAEHITYANAYIEIHMDPTGVMDDSKWYGFTVPFPVDVHNGVSRKEGDVYRDCVYGSHYFIAEYDADKRLTTGKGWKYITTATLNPGQFYYFTVNGTYNTYRFKAAENTYSAVTEKALATNGEGADANWNGVGNSTLQHAKAAYTGGSYVQVYQNGLDAYKTVPTSSTTFVVGCPFFIQASEASTLTLSQPLTKGTSAFYAPRHEQEEQNDAICVNFSAVDGNYSDPIYVSATDKEQDVYVLGHDLSKAGESKMVPQMWVDAYGKKLSVHESNWQGNNAYCTLGLYVPANGEYVISAAQPEDNTRIYLTQNGQPIWDLTQTEYTLSLQKGNTASYGLMIVKAPQITTGVDQTQTDDVQESKVIINNTLFILRNGQMYDASGRKVK